MRKKLFLKKVILIKRNTRQSSFHTPQQVCSPLTSFKPQGVIIEEVQVDQKMKASLWAYWVVEYTRHGPPELGRSKLINMMIQTIDKFSTVIL